MNKDILKEITVFVFGVPWRKQQSL